MTIKKINYYYIIGSIFVVEVFDVMPVFGTIKPGMIQRFVITFFGHAFVKCQTVAQFVVQHGPTYELNLKGQATNLTYSFSSLCVDLGKIVRSF